MKAQNVLETIGNTPHIRIQRLFGKATQQVWIKSERANPGGSIKDRIALSLVEDAERTGALQPGELRRRVRRGARVVCERASGQGAQVHARHVQLQLRHGPLPHLQRQRLRARRDAVPVGRVSALPGL